MKYSQKSHSGDRNHNMTVVLFTLLCVLICGSLALSPKAQTKTSDEQQRVTPKTVPGRNGKIAFSSYRDGNLDIYTTEADGSNVQRLTNNPAYDSGPKWSPDGTKIAFTSNRDDTSVGCTSGGACKHEIYVMNADGTNQTRTNNPVFEDFDWSPDSTRIVFVSIHDGSVNISVMNADGSNVQRLTNYQGLDLSPKWSPDGTKIAFVRTVLRAVAENAEFTRAHFNRAFVLMQYFGYLRRNPNNFPDNNFDGYNFWLAKLDQFNGNFVQAEMVKAFITSIEYRQRFGP